MFLMLSTHKVLEIDFFIGEIIDIFDISISWTRKTDHAGFNFYFCMLGLYFEFGIMDTRHWNNDKNAWEDCDDHE